MSNRETKSELWTISCKVIILLYVSLTSLLSESVLSPWYILSVLLYLCANIAHNIVSNERLKPLLVLIAIMIIVISAYETHLLLLLLLPMNIYELVSLYTRNYWISLTAILLPLAFVPASMVAQYVLVALLSFAYYTNLFVHTSRIAVYRDEISNMRERISQLNKSLVENKEYIRQSEYTFKLEERNRLSQEIHDKIGHSMSGALIQMEASKRLSAAEPEKAAELLQNAIDISKEGIERIRLVLKNMKPPTEQLGINRLRLFVEAFNAKHTIKTVLTHAGNMDLITPLQWKIIMENTKEAFTNAIKYSNANAVSIHIEVLNKLVKVVVADNGEGAQKVIKGLGIRGMEERAASLNGTLIVDGSRGFSVTTLLPLISP